MNKHDALKITCLYMCKPGLLYFLIMTILLIYIYKKYVVSQQCEHVCTTETFIFIDVGRMFNNPQISNVIDIS